MSNRAQQAMRAEQAVNPDRIRGYEMDAEHARFHEVGVAVLELRASWRQVDPYLAATATISQVGATPEFDPAAAQAATTTAVPMSPEVQAHAATVQTRSDAQEFEQVVNQIAPNYTAAPVAPPDVVPQQQFEQPRV